MKKQTDPKKLRVPLRGGLPQRKLQDSFRRVKRALISRAFDRIMHTARATHRLPVEARRIAEHRLARRVFEIRDAVFVADSDVRQTIDRVHCLDRSLGERIHALGELVHAYSQFADMALVAIPVLDEFPDLLVV